MIAKITHAFQYFKNKEAGIRTIYTVINGQMVKVWPIAKPYWLDLSVLLGLHTDIRSINADALSKDSTSLISISPQIRAMLADTYATDHYVSGGIIAGNDPSMLPTWPETIAANMIPNSHLESLLAQADVNGTDSCVLANQETVPLVADVADGNAAIVVPANVLADRTLGIGQDRAVMLVPQWITDSNVKIAESERTGAQHNVSFILESASLNADVAIVENHKNVPFLLRVEPLTPIGVEAETEKVVPLLLDTDPLLADGIRANGFVVFPGMHNSALKNASGQLYDHSSGVPLILLADSINASTEHAEAVQVGGFCAGADFLSGSAKDVGLGASYCFAISPLIAPKSGSSDPVEVVLAPNNIAVAAPERASADLAQVNITYSNLQSTTVDNAAGEGDSATQLFSMPLLVEPCYLLAADGEHVSVVPLTHQIAHALCDALSSAGVDIASAPALVSVSSNNGDGNLNEVHNTTAFPLHMEHVRASANDIHSVQVAPMVLNGSTIVADAQDDSGCVMQSATFVGEADTGSIEPTEIRQTSGNVAVADPGSASVDSTQSRIVYANFQSAVTDSADSQNGSLDQRFLMPLLVEPCYLLAADGEHVSVVPLTQQIAYALCDALSDTEIGISSVPTSVGVSSSNGDGNLNDVRSTTSFVLRVEHASSSTGDVHSDQVTSMVADGSTITAEAKRTQGCVAQSATFVGVTDRGAVHQNDVLITNAATVDGVLGQAGSIPLEKTQAVSFAVEAAPGRIFSESGEMLTTKVLVHFAVTDSANIQSGATQQMVAPALFIMPDTLFASWGDHSSTQALSVQVESYNADTQQIDFGRPLLIGSANHIKPDAISSQSENGSALTGSAVKLEPDWRPTQDVQTTATSISATPLIISSRSDTHFVSSDDVIGACVHAKTDGSDTSPENVSISSAAESLTYPDYHDIRSTDENVTIGSYVDSLANTYDTYNCESADLAAAETNLEPEVRLSISASCSATPPTAIQTDYKTPLFIVDFDTTHIAAMDKLSLDTIDALMIWIEKTDEFLDFLL